MAIFFNFQTTSNHLHPLQVENCDSNSRLVVDEDGNGKFRPERVKPCHMTYQNDQNTEGKQAGILYIRNTLTVNDAVDI